MRLFLGTLIILLTSPMVLAGQAERIEYDNPRLLGYLENKQINESSGICASLENAGIFWTHNDPGNTARLFAIGNKGEDIATVALKGIYAVDFEDVFSVCIDKVNYIVLCDVGTAGKKRDVFQLIVVREPKLDKKILRLRKTVKPEFVIKFKYPEGGQNCESVGFDSAGRKIWIITKTNSQKCKAYSIQWDQAVKNCFKRPVVAKFECRLALPTTTALDISPDSKRMMVLTYMHAFEYIRKDKQNWTDVLKNQKPRLVAMPPRAQGEALCFGPDGKTLYLTSEKIPTPLWQIPVKPRSTNNQ